ncbi:putative uncharacterized protein DDB_G0274435 isoform X3 [Camponotus floridanus]|nr:putative uncharacterized protein DDB_G0274435 isoform X3 [Camponotus floridanus]
MITASSSSSSLDEIINSSLNSMPSSKSTQESNSVLEKVLSVKLEKLSKQSPTIKDVDENANEQQFRLVIPIKYNKEAEQIDIRRKADRAKLNGWDCWECEKYYKNLSLSKDKLQKRKNKCARHKYERPKTPDGFWDPLIPEAQSSECIEPALEGGCINSETIEFEETDSKNDPLQVNDSKNDPLQANDSKNDPLQANDSKNDPLQANDSKNDPLQANDSKNDPLQANDSKNDPLQANDSKNDPLQANDSKNDPLQANDSKNDSLHANDSKNDPLQANDSKNDPLQTNDSRMSKYEESTTDVDNHISELKKRSLLPAKTSKLQSRIEELQERNDKLRNERKEIKQKLEEAMSELKNVRKLNEQLQMALIDKTDECEATLKTILTANINMQYENNFPPILTRQSNGMIHIGRNEWISEIHYNRVCNSSKTPRQFASNIIFPVFDDELLMTSTITGYTSARHGEKRPCNKLDEKNITFITNNF